MSFSGAFETYRNHKDKIQRWMALFDEAVPKSKDKLLLDCGCGVGRFCIPMAERYATVYAVDSDPAMLELAASKSERVHWILGDVAAIPLSDASVDVVLASMLIEHLEDFGAFLRELHRLTHAGSTMLLRTMLPQDIDCTTWYQFSEDARAIELGRTRSIEALLRSFSSIGFRWNKEKSALQVMERTKQDMLSRLEAKSYEVLHHLTQEKQNDLLHCAAQFTGTEWMASSLLVFERE